MLSQQDINRVKFLSNGIIGRDDPDALIATLEMLYWCKVLGIGIDDDIMQWRPDDQTGEAGE